MTEAKKQHHDVIILTPATWVIGDYVQSLVQTIKELERERITYAFGNAQSSIVAQGRELCLSHVKSLDFGKLFWIDGDMSWRPSDFLSLYRSTHDIISGLYLNERGEPVCYPLNGKLVNLRTTIEPMSWVGFGFVCMSKRVSDALDKPFLMDGEYGEDVAFCKHARAAQFNIYLDPTIRVTHHKTIALTP